MGSEDEGIISKISYIGLIGDGTGGMESYIEEEPSKNFLDFKVGELSINDFI